MKHHAKRFASLLLALALVLSLCPQYRAKAETLTEEDIEKHEIVKDRYPTVVSLGDSYSSGEGGEDYYGMSDPLEKRVSDQDWLAHRSASSWPGQLTFVNEEGDSVALHEYRYNKYDNEPRPEFANESKWYFTAVSGAKTRHIDTEQQEKPYDVTKEYKETEKKAKEQERQKKYQNIVDSPTVVPEPKQPPQLEGTVKLDLQNTIFPNDKVDYVTITIGGNDVGFVDIVMQCVYSNTDSPNFIRKGLHYVAEGGELLSHIIKDNYVLEGFAKADTLLTYDGLDNMFDNIMRKINDYGEDIKRVYGVIKKKAPDAAIIVAGYPKLLYSQGGVVNWQADTFGGNVNDTVTQIIFSEYEAETINENVELFNKYLHSWVDEFRRDEDFPIYFVDVAGEFGDHGAYAPGEYVNGVLALARPGELIQTKMISDASFHPNAEGRNCYARTVQHFIENDLELKQIKGKIRVVSNDMSVSAAKEGYIVELTPVKNPSIHLTVKTASDGTFATKESEVGVNKGFTTGEYSLRVLDPKGRECGLLGNGGSDTITLMYHTSSDLDILVSPGKQEVSGTINIRTAKGKAVEADFSDDPLILCFRDKTGRTTMCPAEDQMPITVVGSKGVKYSAMLFPGDYTVEAYGKESGLQYSFSVGKDAGNESVSVPIGTDVKNKNMTLLGNSQTYVGTWVDEITYDSVFAISSTTRITLELGKMMNASLIMEASADINMYGWSESGYPDSNYEAETYKGTWQELDDGVVFYLNGDLNGPVYFDLVKRNTLKLNLNKLESLASSSSQEGLMMVGMLEVFKIAMSMDIGNLFGMSLDTSVNDMLGIDSVDDLLYFTKK